MTISDSLAGRRALVTGGAQQVIDRAGERFGVLDILVHTVGGSHAGSGGFADFVRRSARYWRGQSRQADPSTPLGPLGRQTPHGASPVVDNIEDFRALDPFFRIIEEDWQDSPYGLSVLAASRAQMERSAGHDMRVIFVKILAARVLAAAGCRWQPARCRPDPARWPTVWGRIAAVTSARG